MVNDVVETTEIAALRIAMNGGKRWAMMATPVPVLLQLLLL